MSNDYGVQWANAFRQGGEVMRRGLEARRVEEERLNLIEAEKENQALARFEAQDDSKGLTWDAATKRQGLRDQLPGAVEAAEFDAAQGGLQARPGLTRPEATQKAVAASRIHQQEAANYAARGLSAEAKQSRRFGEEAGRFELGEARAAKGDVIREAVEVRAKGLEVRQVDEARRQQEDQDAKQLLAKEELEARVKARTKADEKDAAEFFVAKHIELNNVTSDADLKKLLDDDLTDDIHLVPTNVPGKGTSYTLGGKPVLDGKVFKDYKAVVAAMRSALPSTPAAQVKLYFFEEDAKKAKLEARHTEAKIADLYEKKGEDGGGGNTKVMNALNAQLATQYKALEGAYKRNITPEDLMPKANDSADIKAIKFTINRIQGALNEATFGPEVPEVSPGIGGSKVPVALRAAIMASDEWSKTPQQLRIKVTKDTGEDPNTWPEYAAWFEKQASGKGEKGGEGGKPKTGLTQTVRGVRPEAIEKARKDAELAKIRKDREARYVVK